MEHNIEKGDKFNRWTVLDNKVINKKIFCECECGTQKFINKRDLYSNRSKSCGCLRSEMMSEKNQLDKVVQVNKRFGKLLVIEDLGLIETRNDGRKVNWSLCKCDCGNFIKTRDNNLQSGATTSCGCVCSRGEFLIKEILDKNNINYIKEYTSKEILDQCGGRYRFDFAIMDEKNVLISLIEFDGRQHYTGPEGKWKNSISLEEQQNRDKIKTEYCLNNNIPLLRIPYFEIGNINLEMLVKKLTLEGD